MLRNFVPSKLGDHFHVAKTPGRWWTALATLMVLIPSQPTHGKDYILTLAGGYSPKGNQASLEANVLFFDRILSQVCDAEVEHTIFFADGNDPAADVQYAVPQSDSKHPATDLLNSVLGGGRSRSPVAYRNHAIGKVSDRLHPAPVRAYLEQLGPRMQPGDRLVLYVTAHGSAGRDDDPWNTTIDCWDKGRITARQLGHWLDALPPHCSVVMVMAQCYCGGFARMVFQDLRPSQNIATPLRIGFFAQQHDRAAAGCRPDISNDREFSSYFWGALVGQTRNGDPLVGSDIDGDGRVTFAEAYAVALVACDTIDVPLRTSDVLLRQYSWIPDYELPWESRAGEEQRLSEALQELVGDDLPTSDVGAPPSPPETPVTAVEDVPDQQEGEHPRDATPRASDERSLAAVRMRLAQELELARLQGRIESLIDGVAPDLAFAVRGLCERSGVDISGTVEQFLSEFAALVDDSHRARRDRFRSRKNSSARRELAQQIIDKWPELKDRKAWSELELLADENQQQLLQSIRELPGWQAYEAERKHRAAQAEQSAALELRLAKMERLRFVLESIVLARNFEALAPPEARAIMARIGKLELTCLGDG